MYPLPSESFMEEIVVDGPHLEPPMSLANGRHALVIFFSFAVDS